MNYQAFKRIHRSIVNKYESPIEAALHSQIESFITELEKDPHARPWHLPIHRIEDTLTELHTEAGSRNAQTTAYDLKRQGVQYPARYRMKDFHNARELKAMGLRPWRFLEKKADPTAEDIYIKFIQEYLRLTLLTKAVVPITETTKAFILKVLAEGVANGWGIDKIVRTLRTSDLTKQRAQLIARTETTKAMNTGAMMAAAAGNVAVRKQWVSAQDNRTRRLPRDQFDHLHMNGAIVEFDEPFIVDSKDGGGQLQYPGDPAGSAGNVINCRCAQTFIPIRDKDDLLVDPLKYNPRLDRNVFYQITNNPLIQRAS